VEHAAGRWVAGSAGEDAQVDLEIISQWNGCDKRLPASDPGAHLDDISLRRLRLPVDGEMKRFFSGLLYVIAILVQDDFLALLSTYLIQLRYRITGSG